MLMDKMDVLVYLSRSNQRGAEAARHAGAPPESEIWIQDLQRPLPSWLTGTPCVAHRSAQQIDVYVGSEALKFLRQWRQAQSVPSAPVSVEEPDRGADLQAQVEAEMARRGLQDTGAPKNSAPP